MNLGFQGVFVMEFTGGPRCGELLAWPENPPYHFCFAVSDPETSLRRPPMHFNCRCASPDTDGIKSYSKMPSEEQPTRSWRIVYRQRERTFAERALDQVFGAGGPLHYDYLGTRR